LEDFTVSSDQNRDEGDELRPDEQDAEASETTAAEGTATGPDDAEVEAPRNRAERRLADKRERRGVRPNRSVVEPPMPAEARPRVPPKKLSGKTSTDDVPPWARGLVDAMARNRKALAGAAVVVAGLAAGTVAWTLHSEGKQAEAASLYQAAVQIELAPIRTGDEPPEPGASRQGPSFPDYAARNRAALEAFQRVTQRFPNAPIAPTARLSEATTLYDLGRYAEARRVYESIIGADLAGQEGRALEGLGFSLEALNDLPAALRRFEEMARVQDGAWRDVAVFHQARVLHRMNQDGRAKDLLHGLLERLGRSRPDDALGAGGNATVYEQGQALLRDIDPSDPLARRPALPNDPDALLRMLERQTGQRLRINRPTPDGGGAGGAGGEP
jgi:tetratricopeptide (TPR) repeat protein